MLGHSLMNAAVPMPGVWHYVIGILYLYTYFNPVTGQCDVSTRPLTLNVTSSPQYVSSPGYPNNNYPSNLDCAWLLTAVDPTARIIMNIEDYDSEGTAPCKYDYITVHDGGNDTAVELAKLCATNAEDINGLTSSGRNLYVSFVSDNFLEYRGFNVLYFTNDTSVQPECGSTITATLTPQVLMSSNLPSRYSNGYNCFYSFAREHYVYETRIKFYFMDLEANEASGTSGINCVNKDHVEISEGASTSSLTPLELWCYSSVTYTFSDINTTTEFLYLNFTTNSDDNQYLGFMLTYEEVTNDCNWPTELQGNAFYDNTRGSLFFTTTTMAGISFTAGGSTIQNWGCLDETVWASEKTLLLRSLDTFTEDGSTWVSYLCLKFTEVSAGNSYYYYQYHDAESRANNERVYVSIDGTLKTTATLCSASSVPNAAFHFIVKQSAVTTAKQYCPPSLLAKMGYVHTVVGGAATCDVSTSNWDVCTDRMVMTFNYTVCNTTMAYSAAGEVWCMANITSTYEYVVVYNTDSSPTYRFACFVVSTDGTTASMVYDECRENQTPTTLAQDGSGTDIGALITMTPTETCPFLEPTTTSTTPATSAGSSSEDSSTSTTIPIVVGVLVGVLTMAMVVAVIIYCINKRTGIAHGYIGKYKHPAKTMYITRISGYRKDGMVTNGHTPGMTVEEGGTPALTAK